jgi:hypothetical protein
MTTEFPQAIVEEVHDLLTPARLATLALETNISWARIVWVDRRTAGAGARSEINRWLGRPCRENRYLPWQHNTIYRVPSADGSGTVDVKIADIRACSPSREPPSL